MQNTAKWDQLNIQMHIRFIYKDDGGLDSKSNPYFNIRTDWGVLPKLKFSI